MKRLLILVLLSSAPPLAFAQNAADAYYDADEMAAARAALKKGHGDQITSLILGERFEYQSNEGDPLTVWEAQAWIGGDRQKLWFKTEGEYETEDGRFEEAEIQALYSRAISPFWDLQVGVRHDIKPDPSRSYAVLGAQGVAPYSCSPTQWAREVIMHPVLAPALAYPYARESAARRCATEVQAERHGQSTQTDCAKRLGTTGSTTTAIRQARTDSA